MPPTRWLAHALEVLFILHADHEQKEHHAMRAVGSSVISSRRGGIAALSGPLHGWRQ